MKKKIYIGIAIILFAGSLISSTLNSGGSVGAKTNSPLDGNSCAQCHGGTPTLTDWISTDIPGSGYIPGNTYTITASGNHTGAVKFGFEVTAEDGSSKVGTFAITDAVETQLTNGNQAVTHTIDGNTAVSDAKTWSFDWTAPAAGTGDVTFYGAFNAANGDAGTSGDVIYASVLTKNEDIGSSVHNLNNNVISVFPNPVKDRVILSSKLPIDKISIYNIAGKLVLNYEQLNTNSFNINLNQLTKGIYFIKVEGDNFNRTEKILID